MLAHVSVPPCCWFSEPRHNSNKTLTIHIRSLSSTSAVLLDCSSTLFVVGLSVCRSDGLSGSQRESVCVLRAHMIRHLRFCLDDDDDDDDDEEECGSSCW